MFYFAKVLLFVLICTIERLGVIRAQNYLKDHYPASVIEDARLDTDQLLRKYKYPAETHFVTTADKYILRMHRIPKPEGRPVFLMHGLGDSSSTWILMGPWSGLGYYLYDQGYDVWMGNARGNYYSRNHTTYDPNVDKSYWTFSWHEIGMYDLPAMIDFVLQQTDHTKLAYFGHSQGTTSFFVMCSMRPAYNDKISIMSALAPVAFMSHIKAPLIDSARSMLAIRHNLVTELVPRDGRALKTCFLSKVMEDTCLDLVMQAMGRNTKQLNMTMLPAIFGHLPAGCNFKQVQHYLQLSLTKHFCLFDYGPKENIKRYGKKQPPSYPLERISAPVALYYALNDYLTSEIDVQHLAKLLPNVVENHLYPYKQWNHIDMMWGIEARQLAHKRMLQVMRKYE